MLLVTVKLSPLSAKVIQYDYSMKIHDKVIYLAHTDILYHILTLRPPYEKSYSTLTSSLVFAFPPSVSGTVSTEQIGIKLHHLDKLKMCEDVLTDTRPKSEFQKIREWLSIRNIQSEDYSFEAALQTLKNFKKNAAKSCLPLNIFVPKNGKILQPENTPLSSEAVDKIIEIFIEQNQPHFTTAAKRPCMRLIRQFHIYAHRTQGGMTAKEYFLRFQVPERTQRHAVRKFSNFLSKTKNLTTF